MSENTERQARWQRAKDIVADALEMPMEARITFARSQCADDAALATEVMSLLGTSTDSAEFMMAPAHPDLIASALAARTETPTNTDRYVGRRLGAYTLQARIGQGGMGVVYRAIRADGAYQQRVAIKLLHDAAEQQVIGRMARERQALAELDHPNIARLLDGGASDEGVPYLVMEYIDGEPIDDYCSKRELDARAIVVLAVSLCAAVQQAHQRLIIHRDIKPANILVTTEGSAKLLDFGIARLLSAAPGGRPATHTLDASRLFTPRYASPEQVRGLPENVATDVYGLGLLLYELLTGASPYARIAAKEATTAAVAMQAVLQDDVRRASQVARRAQHRNARAIDGDLDTILDKACAKEAAHRYETVAQLGDDLTRWLEQRPITARPPAKLYLAKKFVARHRIGSALALIAVAAIMAGAWGTISQKIKAERRYVEARDLAATITSKYYDALESLPGATKIRTQMTADGVVFLDRLAVGADDDPRVMIEIVRGYRRLAEAQFNGRHMASVGDLAGATATRAKAVAVLEKVLKSEPLNEPANIEMAGIDADLGAVAGVSGKTAEAFARFTSAIARYQTTLKRNPGNGALQFELIRTHLARAQAAHNGGQTASASILEAEREYALWETRHPTHPDRINMKLFILRTQYREADNQNQFDTAVEMADREIAAIDAALVDAPNNAPYWKHRLTALSNSGAMRVDQKNYDDALRRLDRALALSAQLLDKEPDDTNTQALVARLQTHRARALLAQKKREPALAALRDSVNRWQKVIDSDLPEYRQRHAAQAMWLLADTANKAGLGGESRKAAAALLAHAKAHPEIYKAKPAAGWLADATRLAGG